MSSGNSKAIDERLNDLEIKSSFNEDLVEQLNAIVARQQQVMAQLAREVAALRQEVSQRDNRETQLPSQELPPHY